MRNQVNNHMRDNPVPRVGTIDRKILRKLITDGFVVSPTGLSAEAGAVVRLRRRGYNVITTCDKPVGWVLKGYPRGAKERILEELNEEEPLK